MKWICIKEGFPPDGERVLVTLRRIKVPSRVEIGLYVSGGHFPEANRFYVGKFVEPKVTHWMPLPKSALVLEDPKPKLKSTVSLDD